MYIINFVHIINPSIFQNSFCCNIEKLPPGAYPTNEND